MAMLVLDDSSMNFTCTARDFDKPNLAFDLSLDRINLDRYLPPDDDDAKGKPARTPSKASAQKTDYAPIRKMILNGKVSVGELIVNNAKIDSTKFAITARDGLIRLDPLTIMLYQGTATGTAAVNVKGDSPATTLQLAVDKLQVAPLLKDVMEKDFLEGVLQARINLSMAGDDAAASSRA